MVNLELIQASSKFKMILQERDELTQKATLEFAKLKGISVEDASEMKGDWNLILELERYTNEYRGKDERSQVPKNVKSKSFEIQGTKAEWTILPNNPEKKVFLYFFGGAYVVGSLKASGYLSYLFSKYTGLNVLGIGYSLAPEKPFPAAIEDAIKGYKWLLSNDFDPKDIVIGGSSAGGGLAVATLLKIKELGLDFPNSAILISPWVDLTCRAKSIKKFKDIEPDLAFELKATSSLYAHGESKKNPFISPVFGDLSGFPPFLIHAGSVETLSDDAKLLAENARNYGVQVDLKIWENMPHDFHVYGDNFPIGKQAFEDITRFTNEHI